MAKKKSVGKKKSSNNLETEITKGLRHLKPRNNKHVFVGGNYCFGSAAEGFVGYLQMEQLNKVLKIGTAPKKKDRTGKVDTFIFLNTKTIEVLIDHLSDLKKNMSSVEILVKK